MHHVVNECPSLGIVQARFGGLVVIGRARIDFKKNSERKHRAVLQQLQAVERNGPQRDRILADFSRCKVLGQTFIEPGRPAGEGARQEIMGELVIDNARQRFGKNTAREDDKVTILSSLVASGNGDLAAVVFGLQFLQRRLVADQQDLNRQFRKLRVAKSQRA